MLDSDRAGVLAANGDPVILIRPTTSPQDLRGMLAAQAVVTAKGGATSHAAVVSRALDKPCVVGCGQLEVRPDDGVFVIDGREFAEGTELSVDGATGEVLSGIVPRSVPHRNLESLNELLDRADRRSGCQVWSRVSSAAAVDFSRQTGSRGIGIVSLTDLLVSTGGIQELLAAIAAYGTDVRRTRGAGRGGGGADQSGGAATAADRGARRARARAGAHHDLAPGPQLDPRVDGAGPAPPGATRTSHGCWPPTSGPSRRPPKRPGTTARRC